MEMASLFDNQPLDKKLSEGLMELTRKSPWAKHYQDTTVSVYDLLDQLQRYCSVDKFEDMVPVWQRSNEEWDRGMQVKFVENVLLGFRDSALSLYTLNPDSFRQCRILDGLQRSTALLSFMNDDFSVFDEWAIKNGHPRLFYSTLMDKTRFIGDSKVVRLRIYRFSSEFEAIDFYCETNENITHCEHDIAKARNYQAALA
jgi:hypothetical protein